MSDVRREFGNSVRQFRKQAKLTQEQLAEAAGISPYYVGQIERGEASPSLSVADDLAQALGIPLCDLFRWTSRQETPEQMIKDIVHPLQAGNLTSVDDLNWIRNLVNKMTETRS